MRRGAKLAAALGMAAAIAVSAVAAVPPLIRSDLSGADRERVARVTTPASTFTAAERFESMSGGAATSTASPTINAFSHPSGNLSFAARERFFVGNGLFRKLWVSSPSSTQASDGLGPLYNARSCQRCHLKDGRGHPPANAGDATTSMLLLLSVPPRTEFEKEAIANRTLMAVPEPTYGGQLHDLAVPGLQREGSWRIAYEEFEVPMAGGETVRLRRPTYSIDGLAFGQLDPELRLSPRVAPPMIGLGLLEAVAAEDILALADPEDRDSDGISGRPSWVRTEKSDGLVLGRYGWKASVESVRKQSAVAFANDIGISTPDFPAHWGDCMPSQTECRQFPTGVQERLGDTEAPEPVLDLVTFYSANLAVPVRRNVDDPAVLEGKRHFYEAGCISCHRPKFVTRRDVEQPELQFQLIWPYTDLLLHDMGEGLADGRPVGDASGREWRTSPLWGIGLTKTVSGHTYLLHDGRARTLLEAIAWHGGEAETARNAVLEMQPDERAALIKFLESL